MPPSLLTPTYTGGEPVVASDTVNNIVMARYLLNTGTSGVFYVRQNFQQDMTNPASAVLRNHFTFRRNQWSTTGAGFGNQPANDGVEMVSSDGADTTQNVTIYYTRVGSETDVRSEAKQLNGTSQVVFTDTDVNLVLGVSVDAAHAGTITIREASANATITTLATGTLSKGIYTVPISGGVSLAYPTIWADSSTTKTIGIIGTNSSGSAADLAMALTGTTRADFSAQFNTVTTVLTGDLETARTVYIELGSFVKMYLATGGSVDCGTSWIGVNSTNLGSGVELQAFY